MPEGQVNGPGADKRRCTPAGGEESNQSGSCLAQTRFSSQAGRSAHCSRWRVRKHHQGSVAIRHYLEQLKEPMVTSAACGEQVTVAEKEEC